MNPKILTFGCPEWRARVGNAVGYQPRWIKQIESGSRASAEEINYLGKIVDIHKRMAHHIAEYAYDMPAFYMFDWEPEAHLTTMRTTMPLADVRQRCGVLGMMGEFDVPVGDWYTVQAQPFGVRPSNWAAAEMSRRAVVDCSDVMIANIYQQFNVGPKNTPETRTEALLATRVADALAAARKLDPIKPVYACLRPSLTGAGAGRGLSADDLRLVLKQLDGYAGLVWYGPTDPSSPELGYFDQVLAPVMSEWTTRGSN